MLEKSIEEKLNKLEEQLIEERCVMFEHYCESIKQLLIATQRRAKESLRLCEEIDRQLRVLESKIGDIRRK